MGRRWAAVALVSTVALGPPSPRGVPTELLPETCRRQGVSERPRQGRPRQERPLIVAEVRDRAAGCEAAWW